ncbi:MAG: single-stranded DNA-binding protein [Anaerolineae bacterium]|jgi:single-strand DNA-binding protein|nr:single-stranded DNA-binding protein [Anaerolineae bacterium]
MSYHQTIVVGNVGGDPRFTHLPSGTPVCNINLAVNETWNDRQTNEKREKTTWYRCAFYGRQAEIANSYVRKGSQVMVIGTVEARAYLDNNGQPAATLELRVRELRLLGGRGDSAASGSGSDHSYDYDQGYAPSGPGRGNDTDDIPF